MAVAAKAPVGEIGAANPTNGLASWAGLAASAFTDDREYIPELIWPASIQTYERMRNDAQLSALLRATTLPITRYHWELDPNGADPKIVEQVSREFGIAVLEAGPSPVGRTRNRFSFRRHMTDAFKALLFGNRYFEQVGYVDTISKGGDGFWHLRKLADRPPWTISEVNVAADGGLVQIKQQVGLDSRELAVNRLVAYVWEQEQGNWYGRSMLRACFREWLLKDRLLRIDVQNHEKSGGQWWAEAAPNATQAEKQALSDLAATIRVNGPTGSVPAGSKLHLERIGGAGAIDSIKYLDESMSRDFFAMILNLGSTETGSRALGGTFNQLLGDLQESIAEWFRDTFNEHVVEDYVDWNWGPQVEYVPRLVYHTRDEDPAVDVAEAVDNGEIAVDAQTKAKLGLPTAKRRGSMRAKPSRAATAEVSLPDRALRREPFDHEVRAAVDFAALDANWQSHADDLVAQWQTIRGAQIAELEQLIADADGDLTLLAQIQAEASGADVIAAKLKAMAATGVDEALAEASSQGVTPSAPELAALEDQLAARSAALEQLLARSLSEAAARRAVALSGGALTPSEVATQTAAYLNDLGDTYLTDQFGGALSAAQNGGRLAAMETNGATQLYSSELLDVNTCEPCAAIDGTEFASIEDAAAVYPAGGYFDCDGGPRCRGTVVAVYGEAEPSA